MTAGQVDDFQPMTVKEAISLLASLQSSQVLPALRHTDFVMLAGLAFQGFRMDAGGYGNPIVRRRLAEEAAKNPLFATKLRELAKQPTPPPVVIVPSNQAASKSVVQQPNHDTDKYRAERDRLKLERDAAVQAKMAADRSLTEAKRELIAVRTAKAEADREAERTKQRLERIERKQRQLETTIAALRRAAVHQPTASTTEQKEIPLLARPIKETSEHPFSEAVRHLIKKDRESVALSIVNDVLRADPDNVDALEIKAEALIRTDKAREAVPVLRSVVSLHLKHTELHRASSSLARLLAIGSQPQLEAKLVREFMSSLAKAQGSKQNIVEPLAALRVDRPTAFALVKSLTPPTILANTFPEQTIYGPDAPLPLLLSAAAGMTITARRLVTAIDRNDQTIVELCQEALVGKDDEDRKKILLSVTQAAGGDPVYAKVLTPKFSRGSVIVDTSNVAWHGQEIIAQQMPRLEYILAIRRTLREKGYFPVILIADANLPYVINDAATVWKMVEEEQIQLVVSGSDADEQILREARRLHAPIVSNDYMADWDPDQTVTKIQYSFTPDGKPTIYF